MRVISRTVESAQYTGLFDEELFSALPNSIEFVCHNGAGYDQIDTKAARKHGITVSNTPGSVNAATADVGIFLLLGAMRRAWIAQKAIRSGQWQGNTPLGHDPADKVVGILGLGGIGSVFAQRAAAFGFKIQYHNRNPVKDANIKYVSLEELLKTSDVISIHIPLGPETRHFIGRKELESMKPGVTIINTARGAIIDEEALVEALKSDRIWSVGLDVYEEEPKVHPDLLKDDRVMLLPHIGTATFETRVCLFSMFVLDLTSSRRRWRFRSLTMYKVLFSRISFLILSIELDDMMSRLPSQPQYFIEFLALGNMCCLYRLHMVGWLQEAYRSITNLPHLAIS